MFFQALQPKLGVKDYENFWCFWNASCYINYFSDLLFSLLIFKRILLSTQYEFFWCAQRKTRHILPINNFLLMGKTDIWRISLMKNWIRTKCRLWILDYSKKKMILPCLWAWEKEVQWDDWQNTKNEPGNVPDIIHFTSIGFRDLEVVEELWNMCTWGNFYTKTTWSPPLPLL